jgi:hypothetical protein
MYGSEGQIKMDPAGGSGAAAVVVASMNAWTLNMARDKADVTAFGDPNKVYVQGRPDLKGTLGGWYDSDEMALFDVAMGDTSAWLELIPSSLMPTYLWSGLAWLDTALDVKASGAISTSGNFVAAGPWTRMPAAVGGLRQAA